MTYFEKALNVRKDEMLPASLLAGYLGLVMGCFIMGKSIADSLVLSRFGDSLPQAIAGTAVIVAVFMSAYVRLSRKVAPSKLIPGVLLFFSFSYLAFGALAHFQQEWSFIPAYLWVYAGGVICPAMGWTLANYALTTREARRVFGLIGAGPILGGACAGFLTAAVGKSVGAEALLFVVAGLQALACIPVRELFRRLPARMSEMTVAQSGADDSPKDFCHSCRLLFRSRYLLLIAGLIATSCFCSTIADFQFKMIARQHFAADREVLTAFFGRFYGWMGLGSFALQLALTGRLLKNFGIRVTLFILPVLLVAGSLGVLVLPTLLTAALLRGSHLLVRFSVDKSSLELLYLPISAELKAQLKPLMDSFVWRLADGIAGVVLFIFSRALQFSPSKMSIVNFAFLGGWIAVAHMARKEYLNVLRDAIQRRTLDPERSATRILDQGTTQVVARFLESSEPGRVLYGLSLLDLGEQPAWHPYLRELLSHPSPAVRERALSLLCDGGDKEVVHRAQQMVGDESPGVRGEALRYLVVQGGHDPLELLGQGSMDVPDWSVLSSITLYLLLHGVKEHRESAAFLLRRMLEQEGPEGAPARASAARILGIMPVTAWSPAALAELLRDEETAVAEQALASAGRLRLREFLPEILNNLARPELMPAAGGALVQYGERVLGTLRDYLQDESVPYGIRSRIPRVLAQIHTTESAGILTSVLLKGNPSLRYEALKALNRLRRHDTAIVPESPVFEELLQFEIIGLHRSLQIASVLHPSAAGPLHAPKSAPLLVRVLYERMGYELERIFLLLALIYPQRDIQNAYYGLISKRARLRANSMEVLEHVLKPETCRDLVFALDTGIPDEERAAHSERLCRTRVASKVEALRILLRSEDRWLRLCAVYEVGDAALSILLDDLKNLVREEDPLLEETWNWTVERLSLDSSFQ